MPLIAPTDMNWTTILPQIVLTAGALLLLLAAMAPRTPRPVPPFIALVTLAATAFAVSGAWGRGGLSFAGMMTGDLLAMFATLVFVAAAVLTVLHSTGARAARRVDSDYYSLLLFA